MFRKQIKDSRVHIRVRQEISIKISSCLMNKEEKNHFLICYLSLVYVLHSFVSCGVPRNFWI